MQEQSLNKWIWPFVFFTVVFSFLYFKIAVLSVKIDIDIESVDVGYTEFKVYWSKTGQYTEHDSRLVRMRQGRHQFSVYLPVGFRGQTSLRIDPLSAPGEVVLHRLKITQKAMQPILFEGSNNWQNMEPVAQLEELQSDSKGYRLLSTGNDPQLHAHVDFKSAGMVQILRIIKEFVFIAILVFLFFRFVYPRVSKQNYVPAVGFSMLILVVALAATSKTNGHPDEHVHLYGVDYYADNWLPPDLTQDVVAGTFSVYGVTRLASYEMYYPLAGYAARVFAFFEVEGIQPGRLFNVLLLGLLVVLAWWRQPWRYFLLPLIISGQTWYLFSYANSDALGLFWCTLVAYQIAYEQSMFNRYLQQPSVKMFVPQTIVLALLFGGLLLLKLNFYFFAFFMGVFILCRYALGEFQDKGLFWKRIILVGVLALSPFAVRYALDVAANGFDRETVITELREKHADQPYKPSQPLEKTAYNLYFKDKGVTARDVFNNHRFFELSFRSAFGVYGYSEYSANEKFYDWVRYLGLILFGLVVLAVVRSKRFSNYLVFSVAVAACLSLAGISFYESWVLSFQPQGRYFMPMLPIFAVVVYRLRHHFWQPGFIGLCLSLFGFALYSFIWIGIGNY